MTVAFRVTIVITLTAVTVTVTVMTVADAVSLVMMSGEMTGSLMRCRCETM